MAQTTGYKRVSENAEYGEDQLTHVIEEQAAKLPTSGFLALALGSMIASAGIAIFSKRKELANFVGLWAPSFLLMGIYSKLSKTQLISEDIQQRSEPGSKHHPSSSKMGGVQSAS